jgi:hypothetical protein
MAKDVVSQPQNVEKSIGAPAQTAEACRTTVSLLRVRAKRIFPKLKDKRNRLSQ